MRRNVWSYVLVMMGVMVCAHPVFADPPAGYPFLRFDNALKVAKEQNKKILVYYGRYGCGYCDKTNKESFSDPVLRKLYIEHYVLTYVDAESGQRLTLPTGEQVTEMELGARLKAVVTPVFIYMDSEGQPLLKVPGFQTAHDLRRYDRYIYGGFYTKKTLAEYLAQNP